MSDNTCTSFIEIADDYGDNHATMRCQLHANHKGNHQEIFDLYENDVIVEWKEKRPEAEE